MVGHVKRMDEYRTARRVLKAEVGGGREDWLDGWL